MELGELGMIKRIRDTGITKLLYQGAIGVSVYVPVKILVQVPVKFLLFKVPWNKALIPVADSYEGWWVKMIIFDCVLEIHHFVDGTTSKREYSYRNFMFQHFYALGFIYLFWLTYWHFKGTKESLGLWTFRLYLLNDNMRDFDKVLKNLRLNQHVPLPKIQWSKGPEGHVPTLCQKEHGRVEGL